MTSDYFVLSCPEPLDWDDSALPEATPLPRGAISWRSGRRFAVAPDEPIPIALDPTHSDRLVTWYDVDALLMPRSLCEALGSIGVDNLDVYRAVIRHARTGFETSDYVAANLLGLVGAADLTRSKVVGGSSDHRLDTDFDGFVVDPARAHGLPMFRLAENNSAVLVHARVKEHVQRAGFDQLRFIAPERWVG